MIEWQLEGEMGGGGTQTGVGIGSTDVGGHGTGNMLLRVSWM